MMLQERTTTSTTALTTRGRQHEKQSRVEFTTYKLPSKHMRLGSHIYTISLPFEESPADPLPGSYSKAGSQQRIIRDFRSELLIGL
jgi:hypothetical protein